MAKRQDADREVLTSLPRSRPVRRSTKRGERVAAPGAADTVATPSSPGSAKRPKRAAKPAPKTPTEAPAALPTAASSRWTDSTTKAAAPKATKAPAPKPAKPDAPGPAKPTAAAPPRAAPRRKVPAAGYAVPSARAAEPPASAGAELISTTIQAAAELAQIGLTVGRQTLQSMLDRLPKP